MTSAQILKIGPWTLNTSTGELRDGKTLHRLEPKTLDLLLFLAASPQQVFSREEIFDSVWPGVTVADDTLARAVSKLRKALGDDPKSPIYIETLPKRGYRLLAVPRTGGPADPLPPQQTSPRKRLYMAGAAASLLAAAMATVFTIQGAPPAAPEANALLARADDFYFQYTYRDNEAAILLYERVITAEPENAQALAGLANALVQRAMRWPSNEKDTRGEIRQLGVALSSGRLEEPSAKRIVQRSLRLAEEAVRLRPQSAETQKALGLALSADNRLNEALQVYEEALRLDPGAWGVLINVADILDIQGRAPEALPYLEKAYAEMNDAYGEESARVRPWQSRLGVNIAGRWEAAEQSALAEEWYRKVLELDPFDAEATRGLSRLLAEIGATSEADRLCRELEDQTNGATHC